MAIPDHERSYEPRTWSAYKLPYSAGKTWPQSEPHPTLEVCNADSDYAKQAGNNPPNLLYADYELIAADLDPTSGSDPPRRLTTDWIAPDGRTFEAGTLLLTSFEGLEEGCKTFCLEIRT